MVEPEINVDRRWWRLDADTSKITAASTGWKNLGTAVDKAGDDVFKKAKVVYDDGWEGQGRTSYEKHQQKISKALVDLKAKADAVDTALDNIANAITAKQGQLTSGESAITGAVPCVVGGAKINFKPANPEQSKAVIEAVRAAKGIRADLDKQLGTEAGNLNTAASQFLSASREWKNIASGKQQPFDLPPESKKPFQTITLPDGRVIVNTGTGDDNVKVTKDDKGNIVVTKDLGNGNNENWVYPPGTNITLRGGDGNDSFDVDAKGVQVTTLGGAGNDKIFAGMPVFAADRDGNNVIIGGDGDDKVFAVGDNNRISTGTGNDSVTSGEGNDQISTYDGDDTVLDVGGNNDVSTGSGKDAIDTAGSSRIYAGEGDDTVDGGSGNDAVVAGDGADRVKTHGGDDLVFGGRGTDYIDGQDGNDTLEGGDSQDHIYGLDGDDKIHGGAGRDNLEGAQGNDTIDGGSGEDLVSGGYGDDDLRGGGDDKLYAGGGRDTVDGGDGTDESFSQGEDTVSGDTEKTTDTKIVNTDFIKVEGSEEFQDRVRADLDMLGSSPTGGKMMDALHHEVSETHNDFWPGEEEIVISETDGRSNVEHQKPGFGVDVHMNLDTDKYHHGDDTIGSQSIMMHELGHVYGNLADVMNDDEYDNPADPDTEDGERVSNAERQATGLDYDFDGDGKVDNVRDPNNPHPYDLTQNAFNEEAGRSRREHYASNTPPR
ncbi:M91 family zinc metallopeptidase [Stackebrandtia nassauensis]|nr:M91 family zinc metallopeptidase [Stackebrandtia nassauensis]